MAGRKNDPTNPVGENAIESIGWTCPSRTIAVLPVRKSQTRPMASNPLENKFTSHNNKKTLDFALTLKQPESHHSENLWNRPLSSGPLAKEVLCKYLRPIVARWCQSLRCQHTVQKDETQLGRHGFDALVARLGVTH